MKTGLHPEYTHQAKIECTTCGHRWQTGSTVKEMRVEVCSNCHPFFTGQQQMIDTAGRVDRFKRMTAKHQSVRRPVRSKRTKLQAKKTRKVAKATAPEA
ncbi:MAG: 50S ribosomal protein L31 [Candidatus Kerfeldbacteria bacterium]|nr:50S ribosomal protein L31 [Candidatus Kerfeldbacteria bacterium]